MFILLLRQGCFKLTDFHRTSTYYTSTYSVPTYTTSYYTPAYTATDSTVYPYSTSGSYSSSYSSYGGW